MRTSSSQAAFAAKARKGRLRRPVSLPQRIAVLDAARCAVQLLEAAIGVPCWSVRKTWKRWPSWSVKESCAPGWGRSRRQIAACPPASRRGRASSSATQAPSRCSPAWVERRPPGLLGQGEDRLADRLGQVEADREAQAARGDVVEEGVGGAARVGAHQQPRPGFASSGSCASAARAPRRGRRRCWRRRCRGAACRPAPPRSSPRSRAAGGSRSRPCRCRRRLLLLGVRGDERRVDVEDHPRRRARQLPDARPRRRARAAGPPRAARRRARRAPARRSRPRRPRRTAPAGRAARPGRPRQSPPSASITARSRSVRPGIVARAALAHAAPSPPRAPPSARAGRRGRQAAPCPPARSDRSASATICSALDQLRRFTRMVILLSREIRPRQPRSSLLRRTSPDHASAQPAPY